MTNITILRAQCACVAAAGIAALCLAPVAHAAPASAMTAPMAKARITASQAEAAAVRRIPGKAMSSKYEFEDGHWQYAVVVKDAKGQMYEAEVSARTGQVTATEKTSAAEEASEAAADRKAAQKPAMKAHMPGMKAK